ncbi:MAG: hypothetical protein ACI9YL_002285 [Luteibaculaceae bacterium]|jgi:hypothetical protein
MNPVKMNKLKYALLYSPVILLLSCSTKTLLSPPVLGESHLLEEQLRPIEKTDQEDRKGNFFRYFLFPNGKVVQEIETRDSIRSERILEFYHAGNINMDNAKFTAGLVLMHSRELAKKKLAYSIFEDLELNGATEGARTTGENWKRLVRIELGEK